MGAVLSIDYGTRRLGLAVTDPGRSFVFPRPTLQRRSQEEDLRALAERCAEDDVDLVILGLPLNVDGTEGPMARAARDYGKLLEASLGREVRMVDERYSSLEADERIRAARPGRRRRDKGLRDQGAAVIILETWLDPGPP